MTSSSPSQQSPRKSLRVAAIAAGFMTTALAINVSFAQLPSLPEAPVGDAISGATEAAQDVTNSATDTAASATSTATDAAQSATSTAQDAAKSATDTARDATKSATDTARDATKSATKSATSTARDATKSATGAARSATKSATSTARDATKSATSTARDATKSATGTARDATRSATDATRDAARDATDTARDASRSATGAARDATRSATGAARDAQRSIDDAARETTDAADDLTDDIRDTAQDSTRDAREAARDAARDARDTAQDVRRDARETVRDTREEARDTAQDARESARDVRRSTTNTVDSVRGTVRDAAGAAINEARDTIRSSIDANTNLSTSALQNYRSADLGLWFDRSVNDGLVIADVATDAALAQVGFVEGDRIVSVNGRTISDEQAFVRTILAPDARESMNVVVLRDGQEQTLVIDPVVIREQITTVRVDPLERFGVILDDRITDRLVVWRVIPRSPAFYAGIRRGDEITMFAGERVVEPEKFVQIVERAEPGMIPVEISRNGRVRQYEVDYPQYQVSEQRTTYRQDLDVEAGTIDQGNSSSRSIERRTTADQLNTNVDADVRTPAGSARANAELDADLPATSDSGNVAPAPVRNRAPTYRGNPGRRGILRRNR